MHIRFLSRLVISFGIATILVAIIWVTSQFKEPPSFHPLGLLILAIAHATFELVYWQLKRSLAVDSTRNSSLQIFQACLSSILSGTLLFTALFYVFKWLDHWWLNSETPGSAHIRIAVLGGLVISIVFTFVQLAWLLNRAHYQQALENERYQNKLTQANLAILNHQLDPHFLFNNFNTLYYLIDENQELAKRFLKNMSGIYRHILQSKQQSRIAAEEEYQIARQYLAILQQRYENALVVRDQIMPEHLAHKFLPPLVLQQLLENAIKHNQIDETHPLTIHLSSSPNTISVVNTINPKEKETSTGVGLPNIVGRYHHVSKEQVEIVEEKEQFQVTIPLLAHES